MFFGLVTFMKCLRSKKRENALYFTTHCNFPHLSCRRGQYSTVLASTVLYILPVIVNVDTPLGARSDEAYPAGGSLSRAARLGECVHNCQTNAQLFLQSLRPQCKGKNLRHTR